MARSPKLAATDSNSRSADGRTKCTSSVRVSDSDAVRVDQQVPVGRRDVDHAGRDALPLLGLLDRQAVSRARISAIRLRWCGSRCCTTTTGKGRSLR